jgi:hypothetical protein
MLVFVPAVDTHSTGNANNVKNNTPALMQGNINKLKIENNKLQWIKLNLSKYNLKNATASYAILNNHEYIKTEVTGNIPHKYQNKILTVMGNSFDAVLKTEKNNITLIQILSLKGNMNNNIGKNSVIAISNGDIQSYKIHDPSAHRSYGWGQAWVVCNSATFYGSIGVSDLKAAVVGLIGGVSAGIGALVGDVISVMLGAVVVILGMVTIAMLLIFLNDHPTSNDEYIPYVEIAASEGKWWDPWDTGVYGKLELIQTRHTITLANSPIQAHIYISLC